MLDGEKIVAEFKLRRLAEARNRLEREIKELLMWGLPKYEYQINRLKDTTEN